MLENLTEKFAHVFQNLSFGKKLTEKNLEDGIRQIRLALLEANVNLKVVKAFIEGLKEKAIGTKLIESISPAEMFIKIVHDRLVKILSDGTNEKNKGLLLLEPNRISSVLFSGLQGAGKTSTVAKIADYYKSKRDILCVSLDIYRPAASEQLQKLSESVGVEYYDRGDEKKLKKIIKGAIQYAKKNIKNLILFDVAGRTQVDKEMLNELKLCSKEINPCETILVCDAMLGQQALEVALAFKEVVKISSLIFSKMDSDSRGGAILSTQYVVGAPIKFIAFGEKVSDLDEFDALRIADRILGKGDVVGLVNKVEKHLDKEKSEVLAKKIAHNKFDLQDFLDQLEQMNKMGSIKNILGYLPGIGNKVNDANVDESKFNGMKAIIQSMTLKERRKSFIINGSRKKRIAYGCGKTIVDVNDLIKKFNEMKSLMKKMKNPAKINQFLKKKFGSDVDLKTLEKFH